MRLPVMLMPLVLAVACGPAASVGARSSAIVGGTNDSADPNVVMVIAQQAGSRTANLCTGEVVSPHVVLTAAHCLDPAVLNVTDPTFTVFTGSDLNNSSPSDFQRVAATHYDQAFSPSNLDAGHDVGVVILEAPLSVAPLPINRQPIGSSMVGMPVRLVGYGITSSTDTAGDTAGQKRATMTTLSGFTNVLLQFNDPTHNTCEGDSGGPALINIAGTEVIAGITSFGDQNCSMGGDDTRIDVYATSFIDPYIVANDGPIPGVTMSAGSNFPPGTIGASCTSSADCESALCGHSGDSGYCTVACDPSKQPNGCPSGTHCGAVDNSNYCLRDDQKGGGCSMGGPVGGSSGRSSATLFVLVALGALLLRRHCGA